MVTLSMRAIATYSCNNGYILNGTTDRQCLSNGQWNTSSPTCVPVDCGNPGAPDNGQAQGNIYTYTSIVTFSCNTGYNLSGNRSIECLSNRKWNASSPTCDPVDCGNPGAPDNGQAQGNIYTYTSIVTFSCNTGYNLSGNHSIECLSNGKWNASSPTCDPVDCSDPVNCSDPVDCSDPGAPDNGQAQGNIYTYTSIVTFSCNTGYNLSGNHSIECLSNGKWNASSPTCDPVDCSDPVNCSDPVDCGDPGAPDNGQAHGNTYTYYTSIVTFSCYTGYNLSNNHGIECLSDGQWNASIPACDIVDCGDPGAPDNGQAHGNTYIYCNILL